MKTVAIIGGGPGGAMAAAKLGRGGLRVAVFEEKLGWEKPCGGGLTPKALRRYPFLHEVAEGLNRVQEAELVAPGGASVRFGLRRPFAIYSRTRLNGLLLERAGQAGAEIVQDRIVDFSANGLGWELTGRRGTYESDFIILAAGARTRLRTHLTEELQPRDFMLTLGYYVPGTGSLLRVQFFEELEGYAWAFPRRDHLSVGICAKVGESRMSELRVRLRCFMDTFGYPAEGAPLFAHLLPALTVESWSDLRLSGEGWGMAGDAAGLVDPLTGEGIYYAMRSGELLGECLLEGSPASYGERAWQEFAKDLAHGARLGSLFYHGRFLGGALTTHMIEFCSRSPAILGLLQDLVEGEQPYATLLGRLYREFAVSLVDQAASSLRGKSARLRSAES